MVTNVTTQLCSCIQGSSSQFLTNWTTDLEIVVAMETQNATSTENSEWISLKDMNELKTRLTAIMDDSVRHLNHRSKMTRPLPQTAIEVPSPKLRCIEHCLAYWSCSQHGYPEGHLPPGFCKYKKK